MRVSREVSEDLVWSTKRGFSIDDPFLVFQTGPQIPKAGRVAKFAELTIELQFTGVERLLQEGEKLAAK
jgi:hypothetical protein